MDIIKYDSTDVIITAMGVQVTGFGTDSKVVVEREGAVSERMNSVDGKAISFNFLNASDGTITITLKYGCPWDTTFDQLVEAKQLINLNILHKKLNKELNTIAAIETQPTMTANTKGEDREWVFGVSNTDFGAIKNVDAAISGIQYYTA